MAYMNAGDLFFGLTETLQTAAAALANGLLIDVAGVNEQTIDVTGTFVGTVTFEGTIDNTNFFAVGLLNVATGVIATTATAIGTFASPAARIPMLSFRARVSAYTSGNITVKSRKASH